MTVREVLDIVMNLTPSKYGEDTLRRWLKIVEGTIFHDVVLSHEGACCVPEPTCEDCDTLIVPDTMAEDVYINYLQMRIAKENTEDTKYNQAAGRFNAAYDRFAKWYNVHHRPIPRRTAWKY